MSLTASQPEHATIEYEPEQLMDFYNIYYTTSRTNATLHRGDKETSVIFYGQTKILRKKPTFYIRKGAEDGEILSFAKLPMISGNMDIGLGDDAVTAGETPTKANEEDSNGIDGDKVEVTRTRKFCKGSDYHFDFQDVNYGWIKDRSRSGVTAYECRDDETGKLYATFLSGGMFNWNKGGELRIKKDLDQDVLHLLLASAMGIWTMEALNYHAIWKAY